MPGTLYLVATPIGNLGDLSARAREVLGSVDRILCEDTRVTGKLLRHIGCRTRMVSFHEHNERDRQQAAIDWLTRGECLALVTDAGTPLVSDPGFRLVRAAREAGIPVRALPGPSALLAALVVSGLPSSSFTFLGFLPARGAARQDAIEALAGEAHPLVLFESARRLPRLLEDLSQRLGPRDAFLARELTKLHEEHRSGKLPELSAWARQAELKGELTLIIDIDRRRQEERAESLLGSDELALRFDELVAAGLTRKEAMKVIARERDLKTRDVYARLAARS